MKGAEMLKKYRTRIAEGVGGCLLVSAVAALTDPWIGVGLLGVGLIVAAYAAGDEEAR